MAEAGLGPAETSKEIAEHARHAARAPGDLAARSDRQHPRSRAPCARGVHGRLVGVRGGEVVDRVAPHDHEATSTRNTAHTAELEGLDARLGDALTFNAWLGAHALGNPTAEEVAARRFRPELQRRVRRHGSRPIPTAIPTRRPGRRRCRSTANPTSAAPSGCGRSADELFAKGSDQGQTGDDYVRMTVYLASVLFLVGISTHFPVRAARYGLLVIGGVILIVSAVQLIGLPKPPT